MHGSTPPNLNFHAARVPALDGIRGIAILLVFAVHTTPILLLGGRIGVDLFFVLSGFLISSILLQEHRQTGAINLFNFYMRRALRLFPAVVLMTAFVLTYAYFTQPDKFGMTVHNAVGVLLYYFNWQLVSAFPNYLEHQWMFSHVWSLSVEEQFYIVWPTVLLATFAFGTRRTRFAIVAAGIIIPAVARAFFWASDHSLAIYFNTFYRLDGLMWGAMAAMLVDERIIPAGRTREIVSRSTVVALIALLVIAWPEGLTNGFLYLIGFALVGLCSATLIYGSVVAPSSLLVPILTFGPLRWVGKVSYGLYLWHWPIIRAVSDLNLPPALAMVLEFSVVFAVATLSFYLIERRFLKLKERFSMERSIQPTERIHSAVGID